MIFQIVLLAIIVFLLIILSIIWPPDSPWLPVKKGKVKKMLSMANVKASDVIYDLGSGDGRILILAAKDFGAHGVGIEIDPLRVLWTKIMVKILGISGKVKIIRGDFFKKDFSEASIVAVYLVPKTLKRLKEKFLNELKPGTRVVSFRYQIDFLPQIFQDPKEGIFGYRIPHK